MNLTVLEIKNPRYIDQTHTAIEVDLVTVEYGEIPFSFVDGMEFEEYTHVKEVHEWLLANADKIKEFEFDPLVHNLNDQPIS